MAVNQIKSHGAGLKNLGNSCFMNATLQCLAFTQVFQNYICQKIHTQKCMWFLSTKCKDVSFWLLAVNFNVFLYWNRYRPLIERVFYVRTPPVITTDYQSWRIRVHSQITVSKIIIFTSQTDTGSTRGCSWILDGIGQTLTICCHQTAYLRTQWTTKEVADCSTRNVCDL